MGCRQLAGQPEVALLRALAKMVSGWQAAEVIALAGTAGLPTVEMRTLFPSIRLQPRRKLIFPSPERICSSGPPPLILPRIVDSSTEPLMVRGKSTSTRPSPV
jgi:hypothetical protein